MTEIPVALPLLWPESGPVRRGAIDQWLVMTTRSIRSAWSENEFLIAVIMPAVFALGFYLPLRTLMERQGLDYVQFLVPVIVLQTTAFTAVGAAQRSAMDAMRGMNRRLSAMPVHPLVPVASRMTTNLVRSAVSIVVAVLYGMVLGFRFSSSVLAAVGFVAFALAVSAVLALGADAIGALARRPEATSQLLVLPQLILGLLSTGFVPENNFPEWAAPFARNQPISHFAATMRGLADGTGVGGDLLPSALWIAGIVAVTVPLSVYAQRKRK